MNIALVLSCEHAVNFIPEEFKPYFSDQPTLLQTHHAIDFGALEVALLFQSYFACELIQAEVSRLLIDCNRSLTHPRCFSSLTASLSLPLKQQLIQNYYLPFREKVIQSIRHHLKRDCQVLHLSIHSFTPIWKNAIRNADVGLLYDPKRREEKSFAQRWQAKLKQTTTLSIRLNYPYLGRSDGLTSFLRKCFDEAGYLGIEVEVNQALTTSKGQLLELTEKLTSSLNLL